MMHHNPTRASSISLLVPLALLAGIVFLAPASLAQNSNSSVSQTSVPNPPAEPLYREYRGVSLGMSTSEVRAKLGKPKSKGPKQDFYVFGKNESAQIYYRERKVYAISTDYMGQASGAPTASEVLGVEPTPKKNGAIYKILRYPEAGFWVTYSRTAGKSPITTVTMQKMRMRKPAP